MDPVATLAIVNDEAENPITRADNAIDLMVWFLKGGAWGGPGTRSEAIIQCEGALRKLVDGADKAELWAEGN